MVDLWPCKATRVLVFREVPVNNVVPPLLKFNVIIKKHLADPLF